MKSTDERSKRAILIFIAYSVTILLAAIFTTLMLYLPYPLYRLPHANFIYSPTRPIVYENVTFDASSSYDLDGWIVSYRWDFEDGTIILGDKSIVEHVFSEFGTRKVTLIVTDNNNLTDDVSAIVTVRKPPIARFAYSPIIVYVGDEVVFDATASSGEGGYIVSYEWDFGDGRATTTTEPFVMHVYARSGTHKVVLTVTDSEELYDMKSKILTVVKGAVADVYTQYPSPFGGQGLSNPSDGFAPQDYVTLYANVTFNKTPVKDIFVAFEVHDPSGTIFICETAVTNSVGVATVTFGVPWYSEVIEAIFGTWFVYASAEVLGEKVNDTLTFPVGWLVELVKLETCDYEGNAKTSFLKGENVYFKVHLSNIALVRKNVTVTITIHDELNVPINSSVLDYFILPPRSYTIFITDMQIPKWAFVGKATAYANAFTKLPTKDGVPHCPEISVLFSIISGIPSPFIPPLPQGWLVELVKLETCDYEGNAKTSFLKGENVYFKVHLSNIALVRKNVTVTITIHDELNVPINSSVLDYFILPPRSYTIFITDMQIPKWAFVGKATAYANAFTKLPTEGGIAYCPETSDIFVIAGIH